MKATLALGLLVLLISTAAGCGGSDDGGFFGKQQPRQAQQSQSGAGSQVQAGGDAQVQTGSTTGACALLTKQDAAAALGAPVKDAESVTLPRQNMGAFNVEIAACNYDAASGAGKVSIQTWKAPQAGQVNLIANSICSQAERINGVGDAACWLDKSHTELQIFKGATFIGLTVQGATPKSDEAMKLLAKKAADKVK